MKQSDAEAEPCGLKEAAIVCLHVANRTSPILQAVRTPRTEKSDSGWQFLCNSGQGEDFDLAEVWSIDEVLKLEPSLQSWIECPFGTTLWRASVNDEWVIWDQD